ncbi:MAG TPA: 3-deoxy-manno-octulosonate cytidylyltransferase [Candidatus Methylacidiphilales bacterium]|jgi:3-deoxy-manno-octulosonate cytidylyltransferase (CMP-KDO synthetase)|nr:3-deoxy-manno-octulosonate cytidylyltransferase [Candidatus Methylacidiphilales bacterium]
MKSLIVIPARYGATRFPGKSLARIEGRPMIQWVWEAACRSRLTEQVVVATDDDRIADVAAKFGADVVMTKKSHRSGTDRMAEVAGKISAQLYVNVQGDEPLLAPAAVDDLIRAMMENPRAPIGTLAHRIESEAEWRSPEVVKVVRNRQHEALYFSRSPLPFQRAFDRNAPLLRHVGIYAFRTRALADFVSLKPSPLEIAEGLEQLRALENGLAIHVIETKYRCLGVDTPADLARVEAALRGQARPPRRNRKK